MLKPAQLGEDTGVCSHCLQHVCMDPDVRFSPISEACVLCSTIVPGSLTSSGAAAGCS